MPITYLGQELPSLLSHGIQISLVVWNQQYVPAMNGTDIPAALGQGMTIAQTVCPTQFMSQKGLKYINLGFY